MDQHKQKLNILTSFINPITKFTNILHSKFDIQRTVHCDIFL